jgi:hypothetical protein
VSSVLEVNEGFRFCEKHPFLPRRAWATSVPIGFHGDGGGFNKHDSLYALSWNSLVSRGATMQTKFIFTVMKKSDMVADSLDQLLRAFSWSMNVLLSGETPTLNWLNEPMAGGGNALAGGHRGVLAQARGDWQFYCQAFYFPQWNCADVMCPFCRASSADAARSWTDVSAEAGWRATKWVHEAYIAHRLAAGLAIPVLFAICLGFRLECVTVDPLHSVDQGVASHIVGSVMWYCANVRKFFPGSTQATRIKLMYADLQQWYRDTKTSNKLRGELTVDRLRSTRGWAKIKSKAASTRTLAAYVLHLMLKYADFDDPMWGHHDELAVGVCQLLVRFYELMADESQTLSEAAQIEMKRIGDQLPSMYAKLAGIAFDLNIKMWKMNPKLHMFHHLCVDQACIMNPRFFWTYGDEDLVGQLVDIALKLHPATLALCLLTKWAICVFDDDVLLRPEE